MTEGSPHSTVSLQLSWANGWRWTPFTQLL